MRFKVGDLVRFAHRAQPSEGPMRIDRIDGKDIYLGFEFGGGNDGLKWGEGNLILDSEWGPTIEKLAKENAVPKIEKGIPPPPAKPDQRRDRKPSKWVAFLKSLEVGDSFLIEYPEASTMKMHAREMGIKLTWRYEGKGPNSMAQERVWRIE
jgi:hypothetical protein